MFLNKDGSPSDFNTSSACLAPLYTHISQLHDRAFSYDRSLLVLDRIPSSDEKIPGFITPEERCQRSVAINARAAVSPLSVKSLVGRPRKLQAMFSESASKVQKARSMCSLRAENIIHVHSASDEGASCIQTQPSASEMLFIPRI